MQSDLKTLLRRWTQDALVDGRLEAFDDLLVEDVVDRTGPSPSYGRASFKARAQAVRASFSDLSITVDDVVTEGDRVAWRWTLEGTHSGIFAGVEPTMKRIVLRGVNFQTMSNGRVLEHWSLVDVFGAVMALRRA
jgi:steroid delta-isomerase-like uncharacterized protein